MARSSTQAARRAEERLDRVFHALADRTRRGMLRRLAEGPAIVRELAEPHAMSMVAVCKHLRVLEAAKLVNRTIDGRVHRCALDAAALSEVEDWLSHYRAFWDSTLDALARYAEAETDAKQGRASR